MAKQTEEEIRGVIAKVIFFDPTDGTSVYLIEPRTHVRWGRKHNGMVKAYGRCSFDENSMPVCFRGIWHKDEKYGWEFKLTSFDTAVLSKADMTKFVFSVCNPLDLSDARKIVNTTDGDIFTACLEKEAHLTLSDMSGVGEAKCSAFVKTIRQILYTKQCLEYILPYKGNLRQARCLANVFEYDPVSQIRKNPYAAASKAHIPFSIADDIAAKEGIRPESEERIDALCEQAIISSERAGNTCTTLGDLTRIVNQFAGHKEKIPASAIASILARSGDEDSISTRIIQDPNYNDLYYTEYMYSYENGLAGDIARLNASSIEIPWHPEYIPRIEEEFHIKYGKNQMEAFRLLQTTGLKVLTGGPGTGKTTTLNGLIRYLQMCDDEVSGIHLGSIRLAALSGKAAQRMTEATGMPASTVHKLLKIQPYSSGEATYNSENRLEENVIIVDEVSMLDLEMAKKLLDAVRSGSLVLFIGDIDQLQSIGAGAVLDDVIKSGCVDVCRLLEIRRQEQESSIPWNSRMVILGDTRIQNFGDFKVKYVQNGEGREWTIQAVQALLGMTKDPEDIQVLSPVRKGKCGTFILNNTLQPLMNLSITPETRSLSVGSRKFYPGDRVIMMRNNYDAGYFNGNIGHVRSVDNGGMVVTIGEEDIIIGREILGDVELSYACTVHKSQGSEYPYVVIVLPKEYEFACNRSLLYTAITRAKRGVIIISEEGTLITAIQRKNQGTRSTMLAQRIRDRIH